MRHLISYCLTFAALIACVSCHRESAGVQPDTKLAAQVPTGTTLVFGSDIVKLKAAPFYQRHASGVVIPLLDAAAERLGVDPRRDLSSALVYLTPVNEMVALFRGSFSNEALQSKLLASGAKRSPANADLLQNGSEAILFKAPGILAVGPVGLLTTRQDPGGLGPAVYARLDALPKFDQLWLVSAQGLGSLKLPTDSNIGSALGVIAGLVTGASVGLGMDDGIHLQADLSCVSTKGAEQVRDALRGFVALGRLTTRSDEKDLLHMYDAIRVADDGDAVHLRADLSPELSDKALAYVSRLQPKLQPKLQR